MSREEAIKVPDPTEFAIRVRKLLDDCRHGRITNVEGSNAMIPLLREACESIGRLTAELAAKDKAISLLNSMVNGGESHSETSREIVKQALKEKP